MVFWGCSGAPPRSRSPNVSDEGRAVAAVLDDWHRAAAEADEERYFAHFEDDAVFLGTDATERWITAEFRAFAHPHFARGHAWAFRATRRAIVVDPSGRLAWFDEDLATDTVGPARGSGVLRRDATGRWRIAQYNLAITVPNERFAAVRAVLEGEGIQEPAP